MTDSSARLDLPYLQPSQAQKHVTHNEALLLLDILAQLHVKSFAATTPPEVRAIGDVYALGNAATGEWAGQDGMLAAWTGNAWLFIAPKDGWIAVQADDGGQKVHRDGNWQPMPIDAENLGGVGIGTTSDPTNRLSVRADATLLSHDGAGHQLKINKATETDTGTLLFQTGWSGRAEMGLAGNDDLSFKVSPDGNSWTTALSIDSASGTCQMPAVQAEQYGGTGVQAAADDTTPGKLMRADFGYGPGNVVGTVSQTAGLPTGAVIESGSNANGSYVRFADGTQICSHRLTGSASGATWTFPAAFAEAPRVAGIPMVGGLARTSTVGGINTTRAIYFVWNVSGSASSDPSDVMALGRWF